MIAAPASLQVEPLRPGDDGFAPFAAALAAERLPIDDLGEPGRAFFQARSGDEVKGFGGFELHGEDALLRSVVVLPRFRGQGLGRELSEQVLRAAARAGARRAWLLTTGAAPVFERLGFVAIPRAVAPEGIRASRQVAGLCPSSATLMTRVLGPTA